jgi:hypothetical protein
MPRGVRKTREQEKRPEAWLPPSVLPEPNPRDGLTHRWIRVSTMGQADPTNVSRRFREGWSPVRAEDYPELEVPDDPSSDYCRKGNVEIGGLVLCSMPTEQAKRIKAYYDNRARMQERATSQNYMRGQDPRMPLINQRRADVSFGSRSPETSEGE